MSTTADVAPERAAPRAQLVLISAVVLAGAMGIGFWVFAHQDANHSLVLAKRELRRADYSTAEQHAREALAQDDQLAEAWEILFEAVQRQGRFAELEEVAISFSRVDHEQAVAELARVCDRMLADDQWVTATSLFELLIRIDEEDISARRYLFSMYAAQGRREEAIPHVLALIRTGDASRKALMSIALPRDEVHAFELRDRIGSDPKDPLLRVVAATAHVRERPREVIRLLRPVVRSLPHLAAAQAMYGKALLDLEKQTEFDRWAASLNEKVVKHGRVLYVLGLRYTQTGQHEAAARLLWESIRRNPHELPACTQLVNVLHTLGRGADAKAFATRAQLLARLENTVQQGSLEETQPGNREGTSSTEIAITAAELTFKLHRHAEAGAWAELAARDVHLQSRAQQIIANCKPLADSRDQMPPRFNPANNVDLSALAMPDLKAAARSASGGRKSERRQMLTAAETSVRFSDDAQSRGIRFTFYSDHKPGKAPRIFESTGGGVAVLDYDLDGHPDLYFAQGSSWPVRAGQFRDRLFRNKGDGSFEDVTEQAGLGDDGYSQGVATGDFDSDGWPDLMLCNLGFNRLYRNNGDGTFGDVTRSAGLKSFEWSTSAAIADFNDDGHPDIYEVNYLGPIPVIEKPCVSLNDCGPNSFPTAQDRLWLNLGDGRFRDATSEAGIKRDRGKGLGLVAADFDGRGRLGVFVANDMVPNFFFRALANHPDGTCRFIEEAVPAGLACDIDGKPQACMGIAVDDADRDGMLDLFVTNFADESNCLYRQTSPGRFRDATRRFGLRRPSYRMLGFGTQFLDADLDGNPDVVLTNGFVYRTRNGKAAGMRAQFLKNLGERRGFVEVEPAALGEYFTKRLFGRPLALIDWNRDGREDCVISHLDSPVALLTNRTQTKQHYATFKIVGTMSPRVPFGTTVVVEAGGVKTTRQLIAGNGYECSNERQLIFGLAEATKVDRLTVRWPNRKTQTFRNIPADSRYQIIEGRQHVLRLP